MLTKAFAATITLAIMMMWGQTSAAQKSTAPQTAPPRQPIPYSQLDAYTKATPRARASKDWSVDQAQTGMSPDTSATSSTDLEASPGLPPATLAAPETAVAPKPSARLPSMPNTPPTNEPAIEEKTQPNTAGTPALPPIGAPTEPK